jgi:hypothetical protein
MKRMLFFICFLLLFIVHTWASEKRLHLSTFPNHALVYVDTNISVQSPDSGYSPALLHLHKDTLLLSLQHIAYRDTTLKVYLQHPGDNYLFVPLRPLWMETDTLQQMEFQEKRSDYKKSRFFRKYSWVPALGAGILYSAGAWYYKELEELDKNMHKAPIREGLLWEEQVADYNRLKETQHNLVYGGHVLTGLSIFSLGLSFWYSF